MLGEAWKELGAILGCKHGYKCSQQIEAWTVLTLLVNLRRVVFSDAFMLVDLMLYY